MFNTILEIIKSILGVFTKKKEDSKISIKVVNDTNKITKQTYEEVKENLEKKLEEVNVSTTNSINDIRMSESISDKRDVLRDRIKTINDRNKNSN